MDAEMGKYTQTITYKGKRMYVVNMAGLSEGECLKAFEEYKEAFIKESDIPAVIDMSDVKMTSAIFNKAREVQSATQAVASERQDAAVIGLSSLQRAVAQMFAKGVCYAVTQDQGKEWLVKEDQKRRRGK
jgi:hypothetical protein